MVRIQDTGMVIEIQTEKPEELLKELREGITEITAVIVESDEFNYHENLPRALATLIRFQSQLLKETDRP